MRKETYNLLVSSKGERRYTRVTKNQAEKAYNLGNSVVVAAVNANLSSPWKPFVVLRNVCGTPFIEKVNEFTFYNCVGAMGSYPKYFVESEV